MATVVVDDSCLEQADS